MFTIVNVPQGVHQYKFYVDGQWLCHPCEVCPVAVVLVFFIVFDDTKTPYRSQYRVNCESCSFGPIAQNKWCNLFMYVHHFTKMTLIDCSCCIVFNV